MKKKDLFRIIKGSHGENNLRTGVLGLLTGIAYGADPYVGPTGSDTNPGTKKDKVTNKEIAETGSIMITGISGHYVEDVALENISISYPGGIEEDVKREAPEDEKRYPEQRFFGILPAWGAYIRHAKNIEFKDVKMTVRKEDVRQKIVLDDVKGFVNH